jgi:hypothetical protein
VDLPRSKYKPILKHTIQTYKENVMTEKQEVTTKKDKDTGKPTISLKPTTA